MFISRRFRAILFLFFSMSVRADCIFADDIRDVKPPVELPANYFWIFLILIFLIAAAFIFAVYFFILKRRKKGPPPVVKPAWTIAFEEFDALEKENLPAQGLIKEFYSRLSAIVRYYVENRFAINAPDMTTEEFLRSLESERVFTHAQSSAMRKFLSCCDMVKFAKYASSGEEIAQSFALARKFVDETKEETPAPKSAAS